jgi:hypothetical protein
MIYVTRRTHLIVLAATIAVASPTVARENDTMRELLEARQNEKKGLMLYVKGQTIAGIVVKIAADVVELRSREYSRIAIRIDSIDGAAMA